MSQITVRFVHLESYTPITEVEVSAQATVGDLMVAVTSQLATEECPLIRVFSKWHVEIEAGGRKRLMELTDDDTEQPLAAVGISHLTEVRLEGPMLTEDLCNAATGQAMAILGAQVCKARVESLRAKSLLCLMSSKLDKLLEYSLAQSSMSQFQSEAQHTIQALQVEEATLFGSLSLVGQAEAAYHRLLAESSVVAGNLMEAALSKCPSYFSIDAATPQEYFTIDSGSSTATKKVSGGICTLRAKAPLTPLHHKWAVKVEDTQGKGAYIGLGLIPEEAFAMMESTPDCYIPDLNGWSVNGSWGVGGDWECGELSFSAGEIVTFDYNFTANTLTICGGGRKVLGRLPPKALRTSLYPAICLCYEGQRASFTSEKQK